jgi:hypothetical protein
MYDVARPVARRSILNSVWMTYAVVRFIVSVSPASSVCLFIAFYCMVYYSLY